MPSNAASYVKNPKKGVKGRSTSAGRMSRSSGKKSTKSSSKRSSRRGY